ncbi:helix-turn-helix domain-containing protein [Halosegnis sp.]|uniref:helix-turn-helix domain-containing protein n=1 Tax=Halosegnis sp. TaxID=2864959 RepID=UPI0035D491C5
MSAFGDEDPDMEAVLAALEDPDCRDVLRALEEPLTADEVAAACDIPRSTAYRKLDLLAEASLVEESTDVRADGHHATQYSPDFEAVHVLFEDGEFDLDVDRPARGPEQRVAELWQEVRDST